MPCPPALVLLPGVLANPLDDSLADAASREGVPAPLLAAIGFEATRWDPDANTVWHGWGMMDLVEGDRGPSLEQAAVLLDVSPDLVARDWRWNVRGAAALLARQARLARRGALPPVDDLAAWGDALRLFSRSEDPGIQALYVGTIFDILETGAEADTRWGRTRIRPVRVGHARPLPPPADPDYDDAYQFVPACADNWSDDARGPGDIDYVVVHTVQGSYSGCISWFQDCSAQVSAHYVVRSSDGQITQMVLEEDVAWHAGNWDYNLHSVGIEHEGWVEDPDTWYTDAMYRASAALVADVAARQTVPLDRSHILGHNEVPGATHTDPGTGWDWDLYMDLISGGEPTATLRGVVAAEDVHAGERLVGASVWLPETGDHTTSGENGSWAFEGIPFGTYTVHAVADGWEEGTCTREITTSGDAWCSIALFPDEGDDTAPAEDTGRRRHRAPQAETGEGGCGCASGSAGAGPLLFGLLALLRRRRPPAT